MSTKKQKFILQWKNQLSGEVGFVEKITADHFENTFVVDQAKPYATRKNAEKAVAKLEAIGEGAAKNNEFEILPVA